ncbi:GNAT family N-acetyltransferase [Parvularcula maris]|uniref:GNAT family N-acetyltransferase n=1 Tax=Parvularcula maris TaxID=2965077 RepID=A0A9X2L8L2_9PROT|nr:GNAT family N-acetyltransferase [Parvularcula maris]MCQ8184192.1 GNAT family N-acetyltransferase [Parvularcula maris]
MVRIIEVPSDNERVQTLIAVQKAYSIEHTPPGSGHAIVAGGKPEGRFFLAVLGEEAAGCIALKGLGEGVAEIKAMHVYERFRGQGIASALVARLVEEAKVGGVEVLKLETGPNEPWAASRAVYTKAGFTPCERYGEYAADPFSYCMELRLN